MIHHLHSPTVALLNEILGCVGKKWCWRFERVGPVAGEGRREYEDSNEEGTGESRDPQDSCPREYPARKQTLSVCVLKLSRARETPYGSSRSEPFFKNSRVDGVAGTK